jgi:Spy/CpxP family protein refolding chaperone
MGGMMMRGLGKLDLTADQKAKVKEVMAANREATQAVAKRMMAAREALGDAATADAIDEAAIRAKAGEIAAAEVDAALLRAKIHSQVFGLLTPDQQAKARQLRSEGKGQMKGMMGRGMRGGRGGRGPGGPGKQVWPDGLGGFGTWF